VAEHRVVDASGEFQYDVTQQHQARQHEVVFVDIATPDYQALIDDIRSHSSAEHQVEVILLDRSADGISEITDALSDRKDITAVHIIGHGADSAVELGKDTLNFESLLENATQIKSWGNALAPGADLLIYGCDVAQNADGRALVDALSRLTGADVSASEDLTGSAARGGNWDLEYSTGIIQTPVVISGAEQLAWNGILDLAASDATDAAQTTQTQVATANQGTDPTTPPAATAQSVTTSPSTEQSAAMQASIAATPLAFEQNVGQVDAQVDFLARGNGYVVGLVGGDALIALQDGSLSQAVRLDVMDKNAGARPVAENLLQSKTNYLVGSQDQWRTDVANFGAVRYENVYDGIDLRYYGNQRQLEYDFVVKPGASVGTIQLKFDGVQGVSVADNGDLVLTLDSAGRSISFKAPVAYQDGPNGREAVSSHYVLHADGTVGFDVGTYDPGRNLVIDPTLSYATYYGGTNTDVATGAAVDAAGNVYLTGYTHSSGGLLGGLLGLGGGDEVFVSKFSPNLGSLIYSTYVGGSGSDQGTAIAVDASGNAYVTGLTKSNDFPTVSPYQATLKGGQDAFVFKLNAAGSAVTYSTYLGGTGGNDIGYFIAVDSAGSAYVTGDASSSDFPTTPGAADTTYGGGSDAFVTKLSPTGSTLAYSTFIGGSGSDTGYGIAVDAFGNAVAVGETGSNNFSVSASAVQSTYGGGKDAFLTKLNATGTGFTYSTYLGGSAADVAYVVTLDSSGKAYLTGQTSSNNFDVTAGAFQTAKSGANDAFVSIVDPGSSGSASLLYSTYLGGSSDSEAGRGIGVDSAGRVYVAGQTKSNDFPVTAGAQQSARAGGIDAFVAVIDPRGAGAGDLSYGTYFGGNQDDLAENAVYQNGRFYVTGDTASTSGIATAGAYDPTYNGGTDAYAAIFTFDVPPMLTTSASALAYAESAGPVTVDPSLTLADPDSPTLPGATIQITGNYIPGEDLLAFNSPNPWGITGTWTAATGTLALSGNSSVANYQAALRSVTYENTSQNPNTATRTVTFVTSDGNLTSAPATRQIGVTSIDNAPVNTVPVAQSTNEDSPLVFSSTNGNPIVVSDVDAGGSAEQVTLSVTNGKLTLAQTTGLTFVTGNGASNPTMTFTGTIANINAAMNGLRFDPAANYSGAASLQIVTNDQGNTGSGGPLGANNTVAIDVIAVNDAPLNGVPGPQSTQQDTPLVFSNGNGNAVTVSDVDAGAGALSVTLTASNGTLTLGSVVPAGLTVSGQGTSAVALAGTLADVNTALDGLTFTPMPGYTGTASLQIATDDQGNVGVGGPWTATSSVGITVSANVAPTVTTSGSALSYIEKASATAVDPGLAVSDTDSPLLDHAIVRVAANYVYGEDVLAFTDQLGIAGSWDPGTATLTLTGAANAAAYQTALRSVTYQNLSNDPSTAARTVTFVANDGTADSAVVTRAIAVTAVNDPPVNTVPGSQSTNEDTGLVFSAARGNAIRIGDPDAGSNLVQVMLTASNGILTLAQISGLSFSAGIDGSSAMTFTGTIDNINAALNGMLLGAPANYAGPASVQIVTNDQGNSGSGGPLTAADTVAVTVMSVNDAPTGADKTVATLEDTPYTFGTADFGFSDPNDSPANNLLAVRISTLPTAGSLTNNGTAINAGDFIAAADIAAGKLQFTPATNVNGAGYAAFTFQVQDDGGTANGGTDTDSTAHTMNIDVTAVNDAPVNVVPPAQSTAEGMSLVFSWTNGNPIVVDDADAGSNPVQVTLSVTNGTLSLGGTAGLSFSTGTGTGDMTVAFSGSLAAIDAALDGLSYTPTALYSGSTALSIVTDDLGNTGGGGSLTTASTVGITVQANQAPTLSATATNPTFQETTGVGTQAAPVNVFSAAADSTIESGQNIIGLTFTVDGLQDGVQESIVVDGTTIALGANSTGTTTTAGMSYGVTLSGSTATVALSSSAGVSTADLATLINGITYQNTNTDNPSAGTRVFTLTQIQDSGGTANGGQDTTALTIASAVSVMPLDDAPMLTAGSTLNYTENQAATAISTLITVDDVDSTALASATVSITGNFGSGEDVLGFGNDPATMGNIAGTYNAGTGVLMLNSAGATATLAQWQTALRAVTYLDSSDNPSTAPRTVSYTVHDQAANSNSVTSTINITAVNDAPTAAAPAAYAATEQTVLDLTNTGLTVGDVDALGGSETVTLSVASGVLNATAGTTGVGVMGSGSNNLTLTGSVAQLNNLLTGASGAMLSYIDNSDTPPPTDTLTLSINDNGNTGTPGPQSTVASSTIGITAVNDPPVNTVPAAQTTGMNTDIAFSGATAIGVDDVDANGWPEQVTLNVGNGTLSLGSVAGLSGVTGNGTGNLVFTGTLADLNSALSGLVYTPNLNYSGADTLSIATDDLGNTGSPGAQTTISTVGITVQANQAPTLSATAHNPIFTEAPGPNAQAAPVNVFGATADSAIESGQNIIGLTFVVDGLRDGANESIAVDGSTITLGAASSGTTATNGMSYSVTLSGTTLATIRLSSAGGLSTADLATLINGITYQNANTDNPSAGSRVFTLTQIQDSGGTANGGADTSALNITSTVNVVPVNDAPTASVTALDPTFQEAAGVGTQAVAVNVFSGASVSTVEAGQNIIGLTFTADGLLDGTQESIEVDGTTITLGAASSGTTLTSGLNYNVTLVGGMATVALTSPAGVSAINTVTLIDGITYQNTNADDPSVGNRVFTLTQIQDSGGITSGGADTQVLAIASTVSVTVLNDAPTPASPASYAATEQTALNLANSGLVITDVDAGAGSETMTLSVASGVLNAAAGTSGVTISGTGTASLTASGTIAQLNDLLAGALGSTLTYINNSDTPPSTDTLMLSINDNGSTGGGPLSATTSATISIAAVNDAPVNGAPGAQVTNANTPIVFSGANAISLSDVDASGGTEQLTLSVAHGTLSLSSTTGLTPVSGANGSASMSYRGTLANLNAALNGMTYIPANNYSGADTLSITSNDQGSTGSGGALISATTVGITVNAPAPPPVVVVPPPSPPAPAASPGPPSPPAPAPSPTPAPPSMPPSTPPSGGGPGPSGGSGAGGEPAQPVGDQAPPQAALVVGNFGLRGAPGFAAPTTIGPKLGSLAIGSGLRQEAMLPGMQTETLTISSTDPEFARAPDTVKLAVYRSTLGNKDWVGELNRMRETIVEEPTVEHRIVSSTVAVTGAMSVGYVIWLLRGGLLLSSLLSSLPAWTAMDPMPVLARSKNSEEDGEDDDPLENLFGRAKAAIGLGRSRPVTESAQPESAPTSGKARQPDEEAAIPA
jgi:hypothetical protein